MEKNLNRNRTNGASRKNKVIAKEERKDLKSKRIQQGRSENKWMNIGGKNRTGNRKESRKEHNREQNREQKRKQKETGRTERNRLKRNRKKVNIQNRENRKENRQRHNYIRIKIK